jgi:hypothetical protein
MDTSREAFHERAVVVDGVTDTYAVANKPWVPI